MGDTVGETPFAKSQSSWRHPVARGYKQVSLVPSRARSPCYLFLPHFHARAHTQSTPKKCPAALTRVHTKGGRLLNAFYDDVPF